MTTVLIVAAMLLVAILVGWGMLARYVDKHTHAVVTQWEVANHDKTTIKGV